MNETDILHTIKKTTWKHIVNRKEMILMGSFSDFSYYGFEKYTGVKWRSTINLRTGDGNLLHSKEELHSLKDIFVKGGLPLFISFRDTLVENLERFENVGEKIRKIDCKNVSQEELEELLSEFTSAALYSHCFLLPIPLLDEVISEKIAEDQQDAVGLLTHPNKENYYVMSEKLFYELVMAFGEERFDALLEEFIENYGWMGARLYHWNDAWTKETVLKRIQQFIDDGRNAQKEYNEFVSNQKKVREASTKLVSVLNSEMKELVEIAKDYVYLRTWRTDILYKTGYNSRRLFFEIAKRAGMKGEDVLYCTFKEVIEMVKTKIFVDVEDRKGYCTKLFLEGEYILLSGAEWKKKIEDILDVEKDYTDFVKGNIGYKGIVKGKVKLVLVNEDIEKVEKGDILVAAMTFPHYIIAMEKAAAFVTDEGGITCHAAIIAREMKKPCVIGTKNATTVFKDGDMVEVDAESGIVRKVVD